MFSVNIPNNIWFNIKGKYFNFATGEITTIPPVMSGVTLVQNEQLVNNFYEGYYVDTVEVDGKKCLVLAAIGMSLARPIRGERIRKWTIYDVVVYDSDKNIITEMSTRSTRPRMAYAQCVNNDPNSRDYFVNKVRAVFNKEFVMHGENNFLSLDNFYGLLEYLDSKELIKKNGKKQKLIDELSALTPDLDSLPYLKSYKCSVSSWDVSKGFAIVTPIKGYKEPCCVLRTFALSRSNRFYEGSRIYVTKKDFVIAKRRNCGDYVTAGAQRLSYWRFPLVDIEPDACKGTMLEYFGDIVLDFNPMNRTTLMFMMCKHPIVEKLYKAGYKNLTALTIRESYENDKNAIQHIFGDVQPEKNLYKALGVNAHQLSVVDSNINSLVSYLFVDGTDEDYACSYQVYYLMNLLRNVKAVFGTYNIASIDNNSFDAMVDILRSKNFYRMDGINEMLSVWPLSTIVKNKDMLCDICKEINAFEKPTADLNPGDRHYYYIPGAENLLFDLTHILVLLDGEIKIPLNFKNYDELKSAHDSITCLYNTKKDAISLAKFVKAIDKLKKYEYTGKEYSVVIPEKPSDLAYEGITLHHCVKSYIDRVADGKTGIVFIRENTNLAEPFYTVEVQDGFVQQIHGFGNCNVEPGSELESFVLAWAKARKLKMNDINKIR